MKDWGGRLLATLAGCVISLAVLLATMGANAVTEAEVSKQIAVESPYVKDRSLILYRLAQIEKKIDIVINRE